MKNKIRENRIQGLIVENNRFLLIKHLVVKESRTFWALPGGGGKKGETEHQTLIREIKEETDLTINLTPRRFLSTELHPGSIYKNMITYLGYPREGIISLGVEPEFKNIYQLMEIKWFDLDCLEKIDPLTRKYILPVRDYCGSSEFKEIHRFLLATNDNRILVKINHDDQNFVLPETKFLESIDSINIDLISWGWMLKVKGSLKFRINYQYIEMNKDEIINKLIKQNKFLNLFNIENMNLKLLEPESKRFIELFLKK